MNSFQLMMDAGNYLPEHIKPWISWMQIVLFIGPVLFIRYKAARWLLLAQVLNTLVAYGVFVAEKNQVTKLFGLGHFLWILPMVLLAKDIRSKQFIGYRIFAAIAVLTISISLVFDIRDVMQWLLGDRSSVLVFP